jgi:protease IV
LEKAQEIGQGQLITGKEALDLKLIDKLGNFNDAVQDLAKAANIKDKPELVFYRPQKINIAILNFLGGFLK